MNFDSTPMNTGLNESPGVQRPKTSCYYADYDQVPIRARKRTRDNSGNNHQRYSQQYQNFPPAPNEVDINGNDIHNHIASGFATTPLPGTRFGSQQNVTSQHQQQPFTLPKPMETIHMPFNRNNNSNGDILPPVHSYKPKLPPKPVSTPAERPYVFYNGKHNKKIQDSAKRPTIV